jgi:hypothetical protein
MGGQVELMPKGAGLILVLLILINLVLAFLLAFSAVTMPN